MFLCEAPWCLCDFFVKDFLATKAPRHKGTLSQYITISTAQHVINILQVDKNY